MKKGTFHITKNNRQILFAFVALLFVLLSSCPIKFSIKALAGIPVKTEQGIGGKSYFSSNSIQNCSDSSITAAKTSQDTSFQVGQPLPAVLFQVAILLLGAALYRQKLHSRYGTLKTYNSLPIFLQYRKLLI